MDKNRNVLSLIVENHSGTLSKIAGLFTRRAYNIDSLNVSATEDESLSRITIVATGDEYVLEQIIKQVNKLIDVVKVVKLESDEAIFRELMFVKVSMNKDTRNEIISISDVFKGKVVDMSAKAITIEVTGDENKCGAFIDLVKPFGIKGVVRTGLTAIER